MQHLLRLRRALLLVPFAAACPLASAQTFHWENSTPNAVLTVDLSTDFD